MDTVLLSAAQVRAICGNVSDMTIWRWLRDPEVNFPRPVVIAKRRYWHARELEAWIEARAREAA